MIKRRIRRKKTLQDNIRNTNTNRYVQKIELSKEIRIQINSRLEKSEDIQRNTGRMQISVPKEWISKKLSLISSIKLFQLMIITFFIKIYQ